MSSRIVAAVVAGFLALALAACVSPEPGPSESPEPTAAAPSAAPTPTWTPSSFDAALSEELLEMLEQDQAERLGEGSFGGDRQRTERMKEIIARHGWPTWSLVGEEAEDAAWAIVQHSDHDPDFQREALEWLRAAVPADDASPGNLAYLEDRIAVGAGELQTYGTQIGCGPDGPVVAPLRDEDAVDERRAEMGLSPLADYLAQLEEICGEGF